jgi:RNA polymerase sigma-70 factor (ECF subfamily)
MMTAPEDTIVLPPPNPPAAASDPGSTPTAVLTAAPLDFDDLYRREWHPLVAFAWSLTGSWAVAEDLVQDAFTDTYRRWDEVARLDRPGAWVRRAVLNRSVSQHRRRDVETRGRARLGSLRTVEDDRADTDRTGDGAAGRVGDPAFWAAVRSLPDRQRAAVALHYLEDRSVAEIAEVLDCSAATVKVHLHRGRRALAARLAAMATAPAADADTTTNRTTTATEEVDR